MYYYCLFACRHPLCLPGKLDISSTPERSVRPGSHMMIGTASSCSYDG